MSQNSFKNSGLFIPKPNLKCHNDPLLVLYTNADCLSSKWVEFSELVNEQNSHVVAVTEVLPKHLSDPYIFAQQLQRYSLVFNKSLKRRICVYIHESIKFSVVIDKLVDSVSECVWMDQAIFSK